MHKRGMDIEVRVTIRTQNIWTGSNYGACTYNWSTAAQQVVVFSDSIQQYCTSQRDYEYRISLFARAFFAFEAVPTLREDVSGRCLTVLCLA